MTTNQGTDKKKDRKKNLESTNKLFDVRKDIVDLFESGIFLCKGNLFKIKEDESKEESKEESKQRSKEELEE